MKNELKKAQAQKEAKKIIKNLKNEGLNLTDSSMFEYCRCYTGNSIKISNAA